MKPILFSKNQRKDLADLGVIDRQVTELQRVLPSCREDLRDPPTLTDVRDELLDLVRNTEAGSSALQRLATGANSRSAPHLREAVIRVQMASLNLDQDIEDIDLALSALSRIAASAAQALTDVGTEQRRTRRANWRPVHRIHRALILGWGKAHYPRARAEDVVTSLRSPPFPHIPSTGVKSPFRVIVALCFDAIHQSRDSDPERAVKSYVRWLRSRKSEEAV